VTSAKAEEAAARICAARREVAEEVTERFLGDHPDWIERYGLDLVRRRGVEDALFHIDFLRAAIELGSPEVYAEYARWAARMLGARSIAPQYLRESVLQVEEALAARLGEDAAVLRAPVAAAVAACDTPEEAPAPGGTGPLARARTVFVQAILAGSRSAADDVLRELLAEGRPLLEIYEEVVIGAQVEVGRLWQLAKVSVAEEHLATAVAQSVVARMVGRLQPAAERRGRAVVTCVEGERHQLGALLAADVLEADGWDTRFLGADLPDAGILRLVAEHGPSFVAVGVTMPFNAAAARRLIGALRDLPGRPRVLVGGRAFRAVADPPAATGADAHAPDLAAAVAWARSQAESA